MDLNSKDMNNNHTPESEEQTFARIEEEYETETGMGAFEFGYKERLEVAQRFITARQSSAVKELKAVIEGRDDKLEEAEMCVTALSMELQEANATIEQQKDLIDYLEWVPVSKEMPICFQSGDWDGLRSELVAVETKEGHFDIARLYSGTLDGNQFNDWATVDDFEVENVIKWKRLTK